MLLSDLPVARLLRQPFGGVSDGGYAGLVFLVSRSADAPALHSRFFEDWSDVHDLTGPYLAVIVPDPGGAIILDEALYQTQWGSVVSGVRLLGDPGRLSRLSRAVRSWPSSVRMVPRDAAFGDLTVAPERPHDAGTHRTALTRATSDLQDFFGISEALLPCLVVVSLREQTAAAVALGPQGSVYDFLKLVKIRLEPALARLRQAERALDEAKAERRALRASNPATPVRCKAGSLTREWAGQRERLAADLLAVAADHPAGELARLGTWMSERLIREEPLTADESAAVGDLIRLTNHFGKLPRRIARTVAKLNAGYPRTHAVFQELAAVEAAEQAVQGRVGAAKTEVDRLTVDLKLESAVHAAAGELGLAPAGTAGLLAGRELSWPITVLARPENRAPSLRTARG